MACPAVCGVSTNPESPTSSLSVGGLAHPWDFDFLEIITDDGCPIRRGFRRVGIGAPDALFIEHAGNLGTPENYSRHLSILSKHFSMRPRFPRLSAASPTMTVFSLSYSFNQGSPSAPINNGDVVTIQNNRDNTRTQAFTYDTLNRILSAQTPNSSLWGDTYVIDAWGNLTNKNIISGKTGGENLQVSVMTNNQLVGMSYDAAGNVMNDGMGHAYVYDAENRMISAGGMSYIYDGDGNRVEKCTAGSQAGTCASGATGTLYWRGKDGETLNESDLGAANWKRFVFFNGKMVARRDSSTGNVYYFYSDHLGSMGVVTDSLGQTIENESDYYPYGGERVITSALSDEHYKFTGKERDTESGLDNFEARYNSSSLARFMSPDPLGGHQQFPQTLNKYSYAGNNPLAFTDPTGLDFYLRCSMANGGKIDGMDHSQTCQDGYVDDGDGNRVIVTSDSIRSGQNSAVVDENGVEVTTGGQTYTGEYFDNPASKTTDDNGNVIKDNNPINLKGQGDVLGQFLFHVDSSDPANGNLAGGFFSFAGTNAAMRNLLEGSDAFSYGIGLENAVGNPHHPGMLNFRFSSHSVLAQMGFNEGPSLHLTIAIDPKLTTPSQKAGDFHVDSQTGWAHNSCANGGGSCK